MSYQNENNLPPAQATNSIPHTNSPLPQPEMSFPSTPIQVHPQLRSYPVSAATVWLFVFFMFVQLLIALYLRLAIATHTIIASNFLTLAILSRLSVIVEAICVLCALRGIHLKHSKSAGILGLLAILVVGGAWLLNGLADSLWLSFYTFQYLPGKETIQLLGVLGRIDGFFFIAGDILLGISFIYGKIYPIWIGVGGIVVGGVSGIIILISQFQPFLATSPFVFFLSVVNAFILIVLNSAIGWVLFKGQTYTAEEESERIS